VVLARYAEGGILAEVLDEDRHAAELADRVRQAPDQASPEVKLELGEIIESAVEAKRDADTDKLVALLEPVTTTVKIRQPSHELDAAHVAVLAKSSRSDDLDEVLGNLADEWRGRATIRVMGPMAPYDFVAVPEPDAAPDEDAAPADQSGS